MTLTLAAALSLFSQFLIGPPLPPLPPEVARAKEEALRYRIQKLPDGAPNGWEVIVAGAEQLPQFEKPVQDACSAAVKGKPHDAAALGQMAAQSAFCRQTVRKALAMSGWQSRPWEPEFLNSDFKGGKAMMQLLRPLVAGMLVSKESAKQEQLLDDVSLLLRYADTAARKATVLVDGLAGVSVGAYTDSVIVRFLAEERFDALTLGQLASELQRYPRSPADLREVFRHEFATSGREAFTYTNWRKMLGSKAGPRNWLFDLMHLYYCNPAMSRRLMEAQAAGIVSHLGTPLTKDGAPGFLRPEPWDEARIRREWMRRNAVGEMVLQGQMRSFEKIMPGIALNQSSRGMISIAVALKRWQLERGPKLPERLQQLVPHYLPSVPVDFMDGKPLRYDRQQRIIYSVGSDLIDDIPPIPETPSLVIGDGNAVLRLP